MVGTGKGKRVGNGNGSELWRAIALSAMSFAAGGAVSLGISTINNRALAEQVGDIRRELRDHRTSPAHAEFGRLEQQVKGLTEDVSELKDTARRIENSVRRDGGGS